MLIRAEQRGFRKQNGFKGQGNRNGCSLLSTLILSSSAFLLSVVHMPLAFGPSYICPWRCGRHIHALDIVAIIHALDVVAIIHARGVVAIIHARGVVAIVHVPWGLWSSCTHCCRCCKARQGFPLSPAASEPYVAAVSAMYVRDPAFSSPP